MPGARSKFDLISTMLQGDGKRHVRPSSVWQLDGLSLRESRLVGLPLQDIVRFLKTISEYIHEHGSARIDWSKIGPQFNLDAETAHAVWRVIAYEWKGEVPQTDIPSPFDKGLDVPSELEDTQFIPAREVLFPVQERVVPVRVAGANEDGDGEPQPRRKRWLTPEDRVLLKACYRALGSNDEVCKKVFFTKYDTPDDARKKTKEFMDSIDMDALFAKHFTKDSGRTIAQLNARLAFMRRKAVQMKDVIGTIMGIATMEDFKTILDTIPDVVTALKLPGMTGVADPNSAESRPVQVQPAPQQKKPKPAPTHTPPVQVARPVPTAVPIQPYGDVSVVAEPQQGYAPAVAGLGGQFHGTRQLTPQQQAMMFQQTMQQQQFHQVRKQ
ncbi:hypothetical protein J8273_7915 [Carpediemonas membranifera]|uniref:Uncharacterized protein n=1 Tax=Carpediemonas membranifera TaxID=201153 RepID=A0A8J6DXN0_9EUKA|nr:hypothetical protein J8273_7915 [Carpediemonas membranifera]|eukprot:KAG9390564.1 hypothetical protein J8273_7915 [Carpediemonas membranifera]